MIKIAKAAMPSADFRAVNIYDLPTLNQRFDGFWACAVLLHIPKIRINKALQSLNKCLKPGAIGMISMKAGNKEEFEVRDEDGTHQERLFVYWPKNDFLRVLNNCGFALLEYAYKPISERTKWHIFFVHKKM